MAQVMLRTLLICVLMTLVPVVSAQQPDTYQQALKAEGEQRWSDALHIYYQILETDPGRADVWLRVSDIHARQNAPQATLKALSKAAALRPGDAALRARLARAYAANSQPGQALEAIEQALALEPDNPEYLQQQAQYAVWTGNHSLARRTYHRLLGIDPDDRAALKGIARMQSQAGQLDRAVATYARYVRQYPQDADVLLEYADTQIYRGDYAAADVLQRRYLDLKGDDQAYRKARANLHARSGLPRLALQKTDPLLAQAPDDYELNLTRTLAMNEDQQKRAALQSLNTLQRLGPDRPETGGAGLQVKTPLRTDLGGSVDYYSDTDDIRILHNRAFGGYSPTPESRIEASIGRKRLKADSGSGLEPLSGSREIELNEAQISGYYHFSPQFAAGAGIGTAGNNRGDDDTTTYRLDLDYRPYDWLHTGYHFNRDVVDVSPRAVDIFIPRDNHRVTLSWNSGYRSHVDAELRYADYDDGNSLAQVTVSPRWATMRTEKHNLDLGVMAQWFGFDEDLNNGYYDPDQYLRLWGVAYYYRKLSDNDGISVVLGLGPERDRDIDSSYELGGNLSVLGTFGIYRDWQLKAWAGVGGRFSDSSARSAAGRIDAFRSYSVGLELEYRF